MHQLQQIIEICDGSVTVKVNEHKDYLQPVYEYLSEHADLSEIEEEIMDKMVSADTIIQIQAYPDPYWLFHRLALRSHRSM